MSDECPVCDELDAELMEALSVLRAWAWFASDDKKFQETMKRTIKILDRNKPTEGETK